MFNICDQHVCGGTARQHGFCLQHISDAPKPKWCAAPLVYRGHIQRQSLTLRDNGIYEVTFDDDIKTEFIISSDYAPYRELYDTDSSTPDIWLSTLKDGLKKPGTCRYVVASGHDHRVLDQLGSLEVTLPTSKRLLCTKSHLPGIHSEYFYISNGSSYATAHVEDFNLESMNYLLDGAPKCWLIISPACKDQFEAQIALNCKIEKAACAQFIRHQSIILTPPLLQSWGIEYKLIKQCPGWLVHTLPGAYHMVVNLGKNAAFAVNTCSDKWLAPPLYLTCSRRCGVSGYVRHEDMMIGSFRNLDQSEIERRAERFDISPLETITSTLGQISINQPTSPMSEVTSEQASIDSPSSPMSEVTSEQASIEQASIDSPSSPMSEVRSEYSEYNPAIQKQSRPLANQKTSMPRTPRKKTGDTWDTETMVASANPTPILPTRNQLSTNQQNLALCSSAKAADSTDFFEDTDDACIMAIRREIEFATKNHRYFRLPDQHMQPLTEEAARKVLQRFDPSRCDKEAWLCDHAVNALLFSFGITVPRVLIESSLSQSANPLDDDLELILRPHCDESHWYLLSALVSARKIVVHGTSQREKAESFQKDLESRGFDAWQWEISNNILVSSLLIRCFKC